MQNANASVATHLLRADRPSLRVRVLLLVAMGAAFVLSTAPARGQASSSAASVVQADVKLVIGGETIKNNSKVILSVVGSSLHIAGAKDAVDVSASSILDISTNEDSRQDITGAAHIATMAIPYGGSRVLSLFSHNVDVLTLEYTDAGGGYHGAIFVLGQGLAAPIKKQLMAVGAKASAPLEEAAQTTK